MRARPIVDCATCRVTGVSTTPAAAAAGATGSVWNGSREATGGASDAQEQKPHSPTADHQGKRRRWDIVGLTLKGGNSLLV